MSRKINLILSVTGFIAVCVLGTLVFCGGSEALVLDVGADSPVLRSDRQQRVIVRVLVRPEPEKTATQRRAPLAVALVLDKSGSMSSDGKMENAKRGALEALEIMDRRDVAAVVVYDSNASVLVPARSAGEQSFFSKSVSRIRPGGSTALYDGVRLGAEQLQSFVDEGYVPRIVLLSDGMANVGPSSTEELARLGRTLARREMTITTIGLGLDYNEDLMTALASESGGNAYFAKDANTLPEIFARDMEDAVTLTARRVRVTLRCNETVRPIRVLGRAGKMDGDSLEVSIDNLYGAEKYALFEVELPERKPSERDETAKFDAATVRLEYLDPVTGKTVVQEGLLKFAFTEDESEVTKNRRADIVAQATLARNAEIREEVVRLADDGRADEASQLLNQRTKDLMTIAPSAGVAAPKVESEAKYFDSLASELESSGRMSAPERKKTLNDAYIQKNQQAAEKKSGGTDSEDVK